MNKMIVCKLTKMRFMRLLAKSMRMDKATNPQNLSKILERNYSNLDF